MGDIVLRKISKRFGNQQVFSGLNVSFSEKKITAITGPSGCGKTTLLRMISDLDRDYLGEIINSHEKTAFVFQEHRLLNWLTVYENIAFVMDGQHSNGVVNEKIMSLLSIVGLQDARDKYPEEISGGMKQRVSLCRAFVYPGTLVLMDEPFTSLDHEMKHSISDQLITMVRKTNKTAIYVTHDVQLASKADFQFNVQNHAVNGEQG